MEESEKVQQPEVVILEAARGFTRNVFFVRINAAARRMFTDQQLINIIDAGGDVSCADEKRNFGGRVQPNNGHYKVTVEFD